MRARTLILFLVALVLAGGTGLLVRSWLMQRATVAEAAPVAPPPAPQKIGARRARRDFARPDPEAGGPRLASLARSRHRPRIHPERNQDDRGFRGLGGARAVCAGDPITEAKIVSPGSRGFLAAVLSPGMRAVSVPVTPTSGISGFVFPGDQVDILMSETVPGSDGRTAIRRRKGRGDGIARRAGARGRPEARR